MTRETKIGLLVGLAFIIVIGILLSDHLTSATEPPQAALLNAGDTVRRAVNTPGTSRQPNAGQVNPTQSAPEQQVLTGEDVKPRPSVSQIKIGPGTVTPAGNNGVAVGPSNAGNQQSVTPANDQSQNMQVATNDQQTHATEPDQRIAAGGGAIVPVNGANGANSSGVSSPRGAASNDNSRGNATLAAGREYKAQPGDSLTKIARENKITKAALIKVNPDLKANPDLIVVGKSYIIPPVEAVAVTPASGAAPTPAPAPSPIASNRNAPSQPVSMYSVKKGDTLWRIATDILGDANQLATLKELNKDVLRGQNRDVVVENMKLRLPAKPSVASVEP
ncbi:MAG TPA: LysM peptidoglycan-binding domain-containing protein [Tepidisphaeraceae bacterium]|jgi:LysM repeat protein